MEQVTLPDVVSEIRSGNGNWGIVPRNGLLGPAYQMSGCVTLRWLDNFGYTPLVALYQSRVCTDKVIELYLATVKHFYVIGLSHACTMRCRTESDLIGWINKQDNFPPELYGLDYEARQAEVIEALISVLPEEWEATTSECTAFFRNDPVISEQISSIHMGGFYSLRLDAYYNDPDDDLTDYHRSGSIIGHDVPYHWIRAVQSVFLGLYR